MSADGLAARTEFRVLGQAADGLWLLQAEPLTGRTHQIRLHAWHMGLPIVGDALYLPDHQQCMTAVESSFMYLHAAELEFKHPFSGETLKFEAACSWSNPS